MSGHGEGASRPSPRVTSGIDTALDTPAQSRRPIEIGDLDVTVSALKRRIDVTQLVGPTVGALAESNALCGGAHRMRLLDELVQAMREIVGSLPAGSPFSRPLATLGAHFGRKCGQEDAFGIAATRAARGAACIERALAEIETLCETLGPRDEHQAIRAVFEKCQAAGPRALGRNDHFTLRESAVALEPYLG